MDVLSEIIETSLGIHLGVYAHRVAKTVRSYLCGLNDTEFGLIFGGYCFTHSKTRTLRCTLNNLSVPHLTHPVRAYFSIRGAIGAFAQLFDV